jgi:hypothetical protein
MAGSYPTRGRVHEIDEDEDGDLEDEDEYDDEEDDEGYSDEEDDLHPHHHHGLPPGPADFFQFGNSLTVKGRVLAPDFLGEMANGLHRWHSYGGG